MKLATAVILVTTIVFGGVLGLYYYYYRVLPVRNVSVACADPSSISSHVYNPSRLQTVRSCVTVSGVVTANPLREADGDYHVWLSLSIANASLANDPSIHNGDLVVEIVCALPITQQDAVPACQNYTNQITAPRYGENITVSGPYVFDSVHSWYEIHPVYSLDVSR